MMNDDEITQRTDPPEITSAPEDLIVTGDYSLEPQPDSSSDEPITRVEEFSVLEFLGKGGFGSVYRAYDSLLQREVALKVPHRRLVNQADLAATYLREARAMASLDHPHIVPVYRAAETKDVACYLVTKLIRGCHFGQWIRRHRPSYRQLAEVFCCVADALAYAHSRGIVHRDIKPGNILIDENDCPYVVDFGLALRDVEHEGRSAYIGTPAYMSPEQARGEGHRVDGRSDIFSLGTVIYQALTDTKPFKGGDRDSLFQEIIYLDPVEPQEIDPDVPPELARICLKSLSKSIHDRYASCELLVDDLKHFIESAAVPGLMPVAPSGNTRGSSPLAESAESTNRDQHRRVIPKGLRPFDLRDADHFLQLLPGPYDRDGLPDIVRFWLARIQCDDPAEAIPVGLIYGPSGCGKTSLVRAGILPRLPKQCATIYVQATPDGTETALKSAIRSKFGDEPFGPDSASDLADVAGRLRRGANRKLVIFIDQFEQWLFSHPEIEREELTNALRQCDGANVQCVLMVRDDFWLGISRLMQTIDLPISENENATLIDLFDSRHARAVLSLFGAAHHRLPDSQHQFSVGQNQFLDSAIRYLATEGRVICVQLALLTEMLKNTDWDSTSDLFKDGGTGIGVRFLDETFDSDRSPRRIRLFAEGAERVLRDLLPDSGSSIKGAVRTEQELMIASGYRDKSAFRKLIAVLDGELHLITPTDRTEDDSFSNESSVSEIGTTGYQLTHDFLIAPIRQWVELRNRTTKAGKARLRLEEFSKLYRSRPMPQALPTLAEYIAVRRYVSPASYTNHQAVMMSSARRHHLIRIGILLLVACTVTALAGGTYRIVSNQIARRDNEAALTRLLDAELTEAISLAATLRDDPWMHDQSSKLFANPKSKDSIRVRAAFVSADRDPQAAATIVAYALTAPADEVVQIAENLAPLLSTSMDSAVDVWQSQTAGRGELLRSACLIANAPDQIHRLRSPEQLTILFQLLLAENPVWSKYWGLGFTPLADDLLPLLTKHLSDPMRDQMSLTAVNLVRQFAQHDPDRLAHLVRATRPSEFNLLMESLETTAEKSLAALQREWETTADDPVATVDNKRPWGSPWWVAGDRDPIEVRTGQSIDESLLSQLHEYEAVIGPHAIVAHRVPADRIDQLTVRLSDYNYRLAHLSEVHVDQTRFFFVLWICDSAESVYELDLTAEQVRQRNQTYRDQGFVPDSIHGCVSDDGTIVYFASWIRKPNNHSVVDADLYIEVPASEHESAGWRPLLERGMSLPRLNLSIEQPDGTDSFTSVRWKTERNIGYSDSWNQSPVEFHAAGQFTRASNLLVSGASLSVDGRHSGNLTSVWWRDIPVEATSVGYLGRLDHLRETQKLMADGYYPVSVDAAAFGQDDTYQFRSVWWRGLGDVDALIENARIRCNLAFAQLRLGDDSHVVAALSGQQGEEMRGAVIAGFGELGIAPEWLIRQIQPSADTTLLRSCVMALKLIPRQQISTQQISSVKTALGELLSKTGDPGTRSAAFLLARSWSLDTTLPVAIDPDREFMTSSGQRMVIVRPTGMVWLGSDGNEPGRDGYKEPRTAFAIRHDYAIATTEVTVEQFLAFRPEFDFPKDYAATTDCPAINLTWYDAAQYCRWLSEQEGIPQSEMCYPEISEIKPGMTLPTGSVDRTGYRLTTETEWELACRGGVDRNRWFGFDPRRLQDHAWTATNSAFRTQPVAQLLPNDFGLFDMTGNVMEWCHTAQQDYPLRLNRPAEDPGNNRVTIDGLTRMIARGGAMLYQPSDARASQRHTHGADSRWVYMGFRIARTIRSQ
ncbi:MAG: SUMF1/EgtB/PvdO family nonheme iron enzyme [Planctomycetales bacterium]|nr:SUMF1/EgtB/PvdO family nonheme iron enzyme [Planctomycetales bacterium]